MAISAPAGTVTPLEKVNGLNARRLMDPGKMWRANQCLIPGVLERNLTNARKRHQAVGSRGGNCLSCASCLSQLSSSPGGPSLEPHLPMPYVPRTTSFCSKLGYEHQIG